MSSKEHTLKQIGSATKWSFITEIIVKILQPVTNAILARLLVPEAFGLVATINMVVSFTDVFTDAGFQKFIVQHEFQSDSEKDNYTNIAFWSNLVLSFVLMAVLVVCRNPIARWTGSPGLGMGIAVASISLPVTSFSSIHTAILRREMNFKCIFYARLIAATIPAIITIPLAIITRNYWALVIGTICGNIASAIVLTVLSPWKPRFYYSFRIFKNMFSFCFWILIESVLIWLTSYIGTLLVGRYLNSYYLGIYKTSMTTVNQIMALITSATSPVIFSVTSRLQNDREEMCNMFLDTLRLVSMLIIPMGLGIFFYQDTVTYVLLGSQWTDAISFIGLFGICNALALILGSYWDGMFNAIGKPKYSVYTQFVYLIILIPMLIYGAKHGYEKLYILRCISRLLYIIVELTAVRIVFNVKYFKAIRVIFPAVLCSFPMCLLCILFRHFRVGVILQLLEILLCAIVYLVTIAVIPSIRRDVLILLNSMNIRVPHISWRE